MFDAQPNVSTPPPGPAGSAQFAELPNDQLEHEVESIAARITAGTCRWLELVGELDHRESWVSWGCLSCAHWLAWRCALTQRLAREHVRVARAIRGLPRIHARFAAGELSYSKVRALSRIATAETESDLLEIAEVATAAQLEQIMRAHRRVTLADEQEAHTDRHVSALWDDDGTLVINARLSATEGAMFVRALDQSRKALDDLWQGQREDDTDPYRGSAEPPPRTPSRADALAAMAETAIEFHQKTGGLSGPKRTALVVHVDAERLTAEREQGRCHIANGPAIASETARRLACDAELEVILEEAGRSTSIGRRSRAVPAPMRRALEARDECRCAFPGCERARFLDAHHIHHWAHGGETSLDNLLLLCRAHHRLIHEGGFRLAHDRAGRPSFARPDGRPVEASPKPPGRGVTDLPRPQSALQPGLGERMRLGDVILAILQIESRGRGQPVSA